MSNNKHDEKLEINHSSYGRIMTLNIPPHIYEKLDLMAMEKEMTVEELLIDVLFTSDVLVNLGDKLDEL